MEAPFGKKNPNFHLSVKVLSHPGHGIQVEVESKATGLSVGSIFIYFSKIFFTSCPVSIKQTGYSFKQCTNHVLLTSAGHFQRWNHWFKNTKSTESSGSFNKTNRIPHNNSGVKSLVQTFLPADSLFFFCQPDICITML